MNSGCIVTDQTILHGNVIFEMSKSSWRSFSRSKLPQKAMLQETKDAWPKNMRKINGGQTNLQISRNRENKLEKSCIDR